MTLLYNCSFQRSVGIITRVDASESNPNLTLYWLKPLQGGPKELKGSYYRKEVRPILESDYRRLKQKNIVGHKKIRGVPYVQIQFEGTSDPKYRKWFKESDVKA